MAITIIDDDFVDGISFIDNASRSWRFLGQPFNHRIDSGEFKDLIEAKSEVELGSLWFDKEGKAYTIASKYANAVAEVQTELVEKDNNCIVLVGNLLHYNEAFVAQPSIDDANATTFLVNDIVIDVMTISNPTDAAIEVGSKIYIKQGASITFAPAYAVVRAYDDVTKEVTIENTGDLIKTGDSVAFIGKEKNGHTLFVLDKIAKFDFCDDDLSVSFDNVKIYCRSEAKYLQVQACVMDKLL